MMKRRLYILLLTIVWSAFTNAQNTSLVFFEADHPSIQYTGRIDFSNAKLPRFWQPGVYITTRFSGRECEIILNDEMLWGKNNNYLEIVVDGIPTRIQTKAKRDTIRIGNKFTDGEHSLVISKNTEANIGYLELVGIRCANLLPPPAWPQRKIEFIGNSITCGAGSDTTLVGCGKGQWHDQHNAYMSYGALTARHLNARYHLSAVSGIGLMHSCCGMSITMPPVFDKISMRDDTIQWNFARFQPDVVTICLGQNDGVQDSAVFSHNYLAFLKTLRGHYPQSTFILLSSPMADERLRAFQHKILTAIIKKSKAEGEQKIDGYFFKRQYYKGCDWHPSLEEHGLIAGELVAFLRKKIKW